MKISSYIFITDGSVIQKTTLQQFPLDPFHTTLYKMCPVQLWKDFEYANVCGSKDATFDPLLQSISRQEKLMCTCFT